MKRLECEIESEFTSGRNEKSRDTRPREVQGKGRVLVSGWAKSKYPLTHNIVTGPTKGFGGLLGIFFSFG
jgi:hypothetical protein